MKGTSSEKLFSFGCRRSAEGRQETTAHDSACKTHKSTSRLHRDFWLFNSHKEIYFVVSIPPRKRLTPAT